LLSLQYVTLLLGRIVELNFGFLLIPTYLCWRDDILSVLQKYLIDIVLYLFPKCIANLVDNINPASSTKVEELKAHPGCLCYNITLHISACLAVPFPLLGQEQARL